MVLKTIVLMGLLARASASMPYLTQSQALAVKAELIDTYNFTQEQLSEEAGLSAASAIRHVYPKRGRILVVCGPGNNGGDGLVCARHLKLFGYQPDIYYPYPSGQPVHEKFLDQCKALDLRLMRRVPVPKVKQTNVDYFLVVDALFGVGFTPKVRGDVFVQMVENLQYYGRPVASIDIPSGWHVELGPNIDDVRPEFLISIGAPKECTKFYEGKYHYLGGRALPADLQKKYGLSVPPFYKNETFLKLEI